MSQQHYPRRTRRRTRQSHTFLRLLALFFILIIICALVHIYRSQHSIIDNPLGLRNLNIEQTLLDTSDPHYSYISATDQTASSLGVDVSTFQGDIDWSRVKAAGVDFVIIRAAYRGYETGKLVPDDYFERNLAGASAAGLHVGVYLYSQALTEAEAEEEADYLLSLINGYAIDYPVVYDQEEYSAAEARTDGLTGDQVTQNALAFCKKIYNAGYIPMLYTNSDWATHMYNMSQLRHYPIWYADYTAEPHLETGFAMWQYTDSGTVDGITGPVDLNLLLLPTKKQ